MTSLRQVLEDERFKYERLEEQMNDMTELNQNEFSNLRQVCLLTIDSELYGIPLIQILVKKVIQMR